MEDRQDEWKTRTEPDMAENLFKMEPMKGELTIEIARYPLLGYPDGTTEAR